MRARTRLTCIGVAAPAAPVPAPLTESEWPLFFTYLILEALFRGDAGTADAYFDKLAAVLVARDVPGLGLVKCAPCPFRRRGTLVDG